MGRLRLIHDCSRPVGSSLNDLAAPNAFSYQTLQDAIDHIKPNYYLAKLDLANAYKSVKIHPSNFTATGLKYQFTGDAEPTYFVDCRLPFGASASPHIFNTLTQSVRHIMAEKYGITGIIAYLDDFLLVASTHQQCMENLNCLMKLLRRLGFSITMIKYLVHANK